VLPWSGVADQLGVALPAMNELVAQLHLDAARRD
jgi:hypothetical protein